MPDREKVIKALECCCELSSFDKPNCKECPAECLNGYMSIPFIQEVLVLLKEQDEEVKAAYRRGLESGRTIKWD